MLKDKHIIQLEFNPTTEKYEYNQIDCFAICSRISERITFIILEKSYLDFYLPISQFLMRAINIMGTSEISASLKSKEA